MLRGRLLLKKGEERGKNNISERSQTEKEEGEGEGRRREGERGGEGERTSGFHIYFERAILDGGETIELNRDGDSTRN